MAKFRSSREMYSPAESWRTIRTLRSEPPTAIASVLSSERKVVFQTSLEQAQQQFTAAAAVGYESRPLNVFYGLSQAGRAIAAASPKLAATGGTHSKWRANGHGIKYDLSAVASAGFLNSVVKLSPTAADSVTLVSSALGSPMDFSAASMSALLSQIPEVVLEFGPQGGMPPVLFVNGIARSQVVNVTPPFGWVTPVPLLDPSRAWKADEVNDIIHKYPALVALTSDPNQDGNAQSGGPGHARLAVPFEALEWDDARQLYFPRGTAVYRRLRLIHPATGSSAQALHPLVAWWLTLFSLSMLARYAPDTWTELMSISSSPLCSKIEFVLDVALEAVPELICEALLDM